MQEQIACPPMRSIKTNSKDSEQLLFLRGCVILKHIFLFIDMESWRVVMGDF